MTLSTALIAASAISTGAQLIGGVQASRESKRQAARARAEAEERARESERETRRLRARQVTGFLKSGVLLEGTPLEVLEETELLGAEDAAAIRAGGQARARQLRAEGRSRLIGGIGGAAGSAFTGIQRFGQF